jgi:hypothetical protein
MACKRRMLWQERWRRQQLTWKEMGAEPLELCQDTWKRDYIQMEQILDS